MPRPRETSPIAAGFGAAVGAALGGPGGAAVGGAVGAAVATKPVTLEEVVRRLLAAKGFTYGSLRRESRFEIHVVFSDSQGHYWSAVGSVAEGPYTPDDLDDRLYDAVRLDIEQLQVP